MNEQARRHVDSAVSALKEVKNCLAKAHGNAENGSIRERIEREISHIDGCMEDCEGIADGLSQLARD